MEALPPIPTPVSQRWREFRIQVLPFVVFLFTVLAIAVLWRNFVQPVGIVGQVETNSAAIIATTEGLLTELLVDRFDVVAKDQPLGQVVTVDRDLHQASLNVIAEDLKLMQARMELDRQRNMDSLARMRLDLLVEQVAIAQARVRFTQAETEFQRANRLLQDKLISEGLPATAGGGPGNFDPGRFSFGYDVAKRDRDALHAELVTRSNLIVQIEKNIQQMEAAGMGSLPPTDPIIEADIRAQQEQLRLLEKPTILKAPMDGIVSMIWKRPGEKVVRGDLIATISAPVSDRVIGYLRQPLGTLPTTNDSVVVRTRAARRQVASGQILRIGAQMELINPLLLSPDATRQELGLPILIGLPPGLRLVPGEQVDLSIQYAKQ
jgi:multidrug resistance efflux pump